MIARTGPRHARFIAFQQNSANEGGWQEHATVVFQQLSAIEVVHSIDVGYTVRIIPTGKVVHFHLHS